MQDLLSKSKRGGDSFLVFSMKTERTVFFDEEIKTECLYSLLQALGEGSCLKVPPNAQNLECRSSPESFN